MPILFPDGHNAPNGWQWAQDAYNRLIRAASRAGERTEGWYLSFPSRLEKLKGGQWGLHFKEHGQWRDLYLGNDPRVVGNALDQLATGYRARARVRNADLASAILVNDERIQAGEKEDPIYHSTFVQGVWERWRRGTRNIQTKQQLEEFKRKNTALMQILGKKAGCLNMSLLRYLSTHPHAKRWPAPPQTEEEYERRKKEFGK